MQWELERTDSVLVVRLSGEFDLGVANNLREDLDRALDNALVKHLIINLKNVSYIDSTGLGVILGRYKRLTRYGGKMALVNPQVQVKRILELSGLMNIMVEYADESEAMAKIC